jgi:N-methylhydantoinase A
MLLGVDVGGTFTDAVLVSRSGAVHTAKVASTPADQSRGVLRAVGEVLADAGARPGQVRRFAHGMTVATNALLEGRGARTALIATEGFTDIVELGRQARPHLYELCRAGPPPLAAPELRFGAPERMTPEGPLRALDRAAARELVEELAGAVPEAVAVVLLHSYAHPEHERLLGELIAERLPGVHISLSHELVGTFREYERAATTEVDAALSPLVGAYLRRLCADASSQGLVAPVVMQSSGGLTDAAGAASHGALTVLSGPAGGVRGALALAELAGERDVLCFDMGGTSCDVCVIQHGQVAETAAGTVAGRPLALAMLDIHTVGAGGGSIAWRDAGGALRVGPRSAGAEPGPACYGRGGELPTVTDANLLLGRLPGDGRLAGDLELDRTAAERAIAKLAAELGLTVLHCAEGIVRVAEAEMLRALRTITVGRGLDPRGMTLLAFGGAGPLHGAALARELGIKHILCPRASGVLCALGLAAAAPRRDAARTVMLAGAELTAARVARERELLIDRLHRELAADDPPTAAESDLPMATGSDQPAASAQIRIRYELRYRGQAFELSVESESEDPDVLREAFAGEHEQRYGYRDERAEVELVTIRVSAWSAAPVLRLTGTSDGLAAHGSSAAGSQRVVLDGRESQASCLRGELPPGTRVQGPAICALADSTLLVPRGWEGEVDAHGTVHLRDTRGTPMAARESGAAPTCDNGSGPER